MFTPKISIKQTKQNHHPFSEFKLEGLLPMSNINRNPKILFEHITHEAIQQGKSESFVYEKNLCEKYVEESFHFFASALLVGGIRPRVAQEAIGSTLQRV